MSKTRSYIRHNGYNGQERVAMTFRAPLPIHKKLTRLALRHKMTINDLLLAVLSKKDLAP